MSSSGRIRYCTIGTVCVYLCYLPIFFHWLSEEEREKEREEKVMDGCSHRHNIFGGGGGEQKFSYFEGSQAVNAYPSGSGAFEKGYSFGK
jgi:hypothetical protein